MRTPVIMGIINVTPDSFSDGGRFSSSDAAVAYALRLIEEGADVIDVGGESTRPGAKAISADEELRRVIPVVGGIRKQHATIPISIDTTKASVAGAAYEVGATMVNDISAGRFDPHLLPLVGRMKIPIVLMHMRGTPDSMQKDVISDDLLRDVKNFLRDAVTRAENAGITRSNIILDPGIGFGKSPEDNIELLKRLGELSDLGCLLLVGTSRKSFIEKTLGHPLEKRLEATLATLSFALDRGATYFRVHDVASCRRYLDMCELLRREGV